MSRLELQCMGWLTLGAVEGTQDGFQDRDPRTSDEGKKKKEGCQDKSQTLKCRKFRHSPDGR